MKKHYQSVRKFKKSQKIERAHTHASGEKGSSPLHAGIDWSNWLGSGNRHWVRGYSLQRWFVCRQNEQAGSLFNVKWQITNAMVRSCVRCRPGQSNGADRIHSADSNYACVSCFSMLCLICLQSIWEENQERKCLRTKLVCPGSPGKRPGR